MIMSARNSLVVHHTTVAVPTVAGWLRGVLDPACTAVRLAKPVPVELRTCGRWSGWCSSSRDEAPDGRVAVSSRARFWSRTDVVLVYIHETAHRLAADAGLAPGHCPAFLAIELTMLKRLDAAGLPCAGTFFNRAELYDLQDPPAAAALADQARSAWLPRCLAWAMQQAEELAPTGISAEVVAVEIAGRYSAWCAELEAEPEKRAAAATVAAESKAKAARAAHAQAQEIARLQRMADARGILVLVAGLMLAMVLLLVAAWR